MTALLLATALAAAEPGPRQWMELGREFLEQGVADQALRAYESALAASDGPCGECELGAARALVGMARFDEAAERARRASKLIEYESAARLALGRALLRAPGHDSASEDLAEAAALFRGLWREGRVEAGLYLGETLSRRGEDDEAAETLRAYLEASADAAGRARAKQLLALPHCGREACLPAFEMAGLDGTLWNNERLLGRVALLDFWATWCAPCLDALPELKLLAAEYAGRPFVLLGLSADGDPTALEAVIEGENLGWPQLRDADGSTIAGRFGVRAYPAYLVVDRDGIVRGRFGAAALYNGELERRIGELLAD